MLLTAAAADAHSTPDMSKRFVTALNSNQQYGRSDTHTHFSVDLDWCLPWLLNVYQTLIIYSDVHFKTPEMPGHNVPRRQASSAKPGSVNSSLLQSPEGIGNLYRQDPPKEMAGTEAGLCCMRSTSTALAC